MASIPCAPPKPVNARDESCYRDIISLKGQIAQALVEYRGINFYEQLEDCAPTEDNLKLHLQLLLDILNNETRHC